MKVRNPFIAVCILMISALTAPWAHAQVVEAAPIVVHEKVPSDRSRFKGEVISATNSSITVRDAGNDRRIRTFSYSPALGDKMKGVMDRGGYQPGDKVDIRYHSRTDQAWNIKGKPSVPR
jgi:hypothetical protein